MASTQTVSTPQRGVVDVVLTKDDLDALNTVPGAEIRVPNGRYVLVIKAETDTVIDEDDMDDSDLIALGAIDPLS